MKKIFFSIFLMFCLNTFSNVNYNVFVIMDNNATRNVENISKGLKEAGIESLYSKGYAVHLTLYLTEYKPEALKTIKNTVNKIANQTNNSQLEQVSCKGCKSSRLGKIYS